VTHHVEGGVNPRNVGNAMHRFVEVSQDRLSLNTLAKGQDGKERVTLRMWERVRAYGNVSCHQHSRSQ
jgi:hypothetical protein